MHEMIFSSYFRKNGWKEFLEICPYVSLDILYVQEGLSILSQQVVVIQTWTRLVGHMVCIIFF